MKRALFAVSIRVLAVSMMRALFAVSIMLSAPNDIDYAIKRALSAVSTMLPAISFMLLSVHSLL
jgi:hypothetical protein